MIVSTELSNGTAKVIVYSLIAPTVIKATEEGKTDRVVFTTANWSYNNGRLVVRQGEAV